MRTPLIKALAIATGLALSAGGAKAVTIAGTYSVTGTNFASTVASPLDSITESFSISFDNFSTVSEQTTGISLNASTITPASPVAFTYIAGLDTLIVGGTAGSVATADLASTDFALVINNASNVAAFGITSLTYSTNGAVFSAQTTGRATATATPEPASIVLLGSAVAAIGLLAFAGQSDV